MKMRRFYRNKLGSLAMLFIGIVSSGILFGAVLFWLLFAKRKMIFSHWVQASTETKKRLCDSRAFLETKIIILRVKFGVRPIFSLSDDLRYAPTEVIAKNIDDNQNVPDVSKASDSIYFGVSIEKISEYTFVSMSVFMIQIF